MLIVTHGIHLGSLVMDDMLEDLAKTEVYLAVKEADRAALDVEIKTLKNHMVMLEGKITAEMLEHGVVMTEFGGVKYGLRKNPPKPFVTDESVLPEEYFRIKRELDKAKINKAVLDGTVLFGVSIDNGSISLVRR